MKLSVACTFAPDLLPRVSLYPEVREMYGKIPADAIGGGRSAYTLRSVNKRTVLKTIRQCHEKNIAFNYLLNAANLGGMEQTRQGQKKIRSLLDWVVSSGADGVTVASPYLLRIIKKQYPALWVKVGVFAMVDNPVKARMWEDMGADCICLSAISCNRNFPLLQNIRAAASCELQLIVNASCLLHCTHELTHMNLLSQSSRVGDSLGGFCLDYCILHCSHRRLEDPVNFIRATWIRPEDLHYYESIGYDSFKIVERSSPTDLLVKRIDAYTKRRFDGNLLEIAGPVAYIKRDQQLPWYRRMRIIRFMLRPDKVPLSSLLRIKEYAEDIIIHEYDRDRAPIYIDNKGLEGFLDGIRKRDCASLNCRTCGYCDSWAQKTVTFNETYRKEVLRKARSLDTQLLDGSLW